ncbi:hypothetical protein E4U55_007796 [Claviceps digitariae]|nr:hypothetical protein E4U55_007796 [Claviceps digitariae]
MELNYDCVGEPAHWDMDYTMFLASDPGQLPEYEPMDALLPPESIGFWPPGGLPLLNADPFGMGRMAGIVSGASSKTPQYHQLPTATATASASPIATAHGELQYPLWPAHMAMDQAAVAVAVPAPDYSYSQDLMPSPASQQSICSGSPDETPVASPLTPSSDDAASLGLDASVHESAWAKADLHFQSVDAFRDDIMRYSTAVTDNEATPPAWCWGIDTTVAASLMHLNTTGSAPLYESSSCSAPLSRRLSHHPHHRHPPPPSSFFSSVHKPYSVPQALFHMESATNTDITTPCSDTGSRSASRTNTDTTDTSSNMNVAFVRPRRGKQSVEQRRRNHIQQEQRRRAMLKNGFSDLTDLVPGLGTRDMSKSAILEKTAEWLDRLVCGNKFLRDRLALMTTMNQQTQQLWMRAESDLGFVLT